MKIAIIGAGNMGGSIARGFINSGTVKPENLTVSNPSKGKLERLSEDCPGVNVTSDNIEAVQNATVVILAVKPWKVADVISEILPALNFENMILVSVAAGIDTSGLATLIGRPLKELSPLYYVIPNTAASLGESMTFVAGANRNEESDKIVTDLFSSIGEVMIIEEKLMGACMALASCGIAYAMRYIRAAMEGGVELGVPAAQAQKIVCQTLNGAVALLSDGAHPEVEIDKVTTPGGITIKGLNAMEKAGFTNSVIEGLRASVK